MENPPNAVDTVIAKIFSRQELSKDEIQVKKLQAGIKANIDSMVGNDKNIYLLLVETLSRIQTSSEIWEMLSRYIEKGLAATPANVTKTPPPIAFTDYQELKSAFQTISNAEAIKIYLKILTESGETSAIFLAKWSQQHENSPEKMIQLYQSLKAMQGKISTVDLKYVPFNEIALTFSDLVLYLEYIHTTNRFDTKGASEYIESQKNRQTGYR